LRSWKDCAYQQKQKKKLERFAKTIRQQRKKPGRIAKVPCTYAKGRNPLCRSRKRRGAAAAAAGLEVSKLSFATLQITQKRRSFRVQESERRRHEKKKVIAIDCFLWICSAISFFAVVD
jgi:hypothetical protein